MLQRQLRVGDIVDDYCPRERRITNHVVVAMIDGEATVKRFLRDGPRIVLKPENRAMQPIVVDPAERRLHILGKVIGLLRGF